MSLKIVHSELKSIVKDHSFNFDQPKIKYFNEIDATLFLFAIPVLPATASVVFLVINKLYNL